MSTTVTAPQAVQQRSVVLVVPDQELRQQLNGTLSGMRWNVIATASGAEAMVYLSENMPEALIVDHWLPDLETGEFAAHATSICPGTDILHMDGSAGGSGAKSARRNELLFALREALDAAGPTPKQAEEQPPKQALTDGAAWLSAPACIPRTAAISHPFSPGQISLNRDPVQARAAIELHLPDTVGDSAPMRELARLVRLVAPHTATVLIQGETGTGKELVAKALHRLSSRAAKPFVVLNCAAIPEHLLEAELFGHTRGAFTGAVTSRMGRIEAAHGGTLFLDEIGEMPLALQAKLLRFLENGEIQRVGDNGVFRVDVRIVAATHQLLEQNAEEKLFRLDLYHRLAVFPVEVPPLRSRREDIPMLVEHQLGKLGTDAPRRGISAEAMSMLMAYDWWGNVRELCHVLQRAAILAGDEPKIAAGHIRLRASVR